MASYNRIIIMGNLTRDPEYRQLPSGQGVCKLGIASNRQFKNKQTGLMSQEVCFIDAEVWGAQAENCRQYLQKGKSVLVEGRIKLDSWKEADGSNRSKHSIVADRVLFLSPQTSAEANYEGSEDISTGISTRSYKTADKNVNSRKGATLANDELGSGLDITGFKDEAPFEDDLPF
ncbi:MAG TPA: single-stranded DNA-binding protein [Candidatus Babeliaceae bacterium]|nr:single-stranded DNA-binding protein [Candidatus Babeliaceae bacterium]